MSPQQTQLDIEYIRKTLYTSLKDQVLLQTPPFNQRENSFVNLNKTLSILQNDTIKKYENNVSTQLKQKGPSGHLKIGTKIKQQEYLYPKIVKKFIPSPWDHENQNSDGQKKQFLTQTNETNKKKSDLYKSFRISIGGRDQKKNSRLKIFRSTFSAQPYQNKQAAIQNKKLETEMQSSLSHYNQKDDIISRNYSYNNQQKARISLQFMVHEKKHKKMSKILRMKTHCQDKTIFKHENNNHHSKFLIKALEKLSSGKVFKRSTDRSVQALKRKSNSSYKLHNKREQDHLISQQRQSKWLSCLKFQMVSTFKQTSLRKYINYPIKKLEPQFKVNDTERKVAGNQKCKVSFKPKRKWMNETKNNFNTKSQNKIKLTSTKEPTSNLIRINHLLA